MRVQSDHRQTGGRWIGLFSDSFLTKYEHSTVNYACREPKVDWHGLLSSDFVRWRSCQFHEAFR